MKKLWKPALLLAAIAIMAYGTIGSGAWFTDKEVVAGNAFVADKLDLELGSAGSLPYQVSDIAPGESGKFTIRLTNTEGSMDGALDIKLANMVQAENGLVEPELEAGDYENGGDLYLSLVMAAYLDVNKDGSFNAGDIQLAYNGQKQAYPGFWSGDFHYHSVSSNLVPWNDIMTLAAGNSVDLVIMWQLPTEWTYSNYNQNIVMTDSLGFDVQTSLEQVDGVGGVGE